MVPSFSETPEAGGVRRRPVLAALSTACTKASVGALVASVPATIRIAPATPCGALGAWLALSALSFAPILVMLVVMGRARSELRDTLGATASQSAAFWNAVAVWAALDALALGVLGALLRRTTHHHALAGVTFALGACALSILLIPTARRVVEVCGDHSRVVAALAILVLGFVAGAVLRAHANGTALDLLTFFVVVVVVSFVETRGSFGIFGSPLAVVVVVGGFWVLATCPDIVEVASGTAPFYAWVLDPPTPSD